MVNAHEIHHYYLSTQNVLGLVCWQYDGAFKGYLAAENKRIELGFYYNHLKMLADF